MIRLLTETDPVATRQVGWVGTPAIGVAGTEGTRLMLTDELLGDVHPRVTSV